MLNEIRKLSASNLRRLCISKNWYTYGDNEEYGKILNYADTRENITAADIVTIAEDIKAHSDTDYEIPSICFEIARSCYSFFE